MKIIRVFGVVVGIHLFALMLIFANPGCSSTSKPAPKPAETASAPAPSAPVVTVPLAGAADASSISAAPIGFDPAAPAVAGVRYSPTRPGTPAASAIVAAPVADVTPATTYLVAKGDSLWTIAKKNQLTVAELAAANNLKPASTLRLGQKLIIPGKAPASGGAGTAQAPAASIVPTATPANGATPADAGKAKGESISHTVKMGESLGTIARKYGVRQGDIAVANNITDPQKITAGQILSIPGWQTPVAKAKAAAKPADPVAKPAEPARSYFVVPPVEQDLDSGLKPVPVTEVPVIRVDDPAAPAPKPAP
jgi:LysM repeat protein